VDVTSVRFLGCHIGLPGLYAGDVAPGLKAAGDVGLNRLRPRAGFVAGDVGL